MKAMGLGGCLVLEDGVGGGGSLEQLETKRKGFPSVLHILYSLDVRKRVGAVMVRLSQEVRVSRFPSFGVAVVIVATGQ